MRGGPHAPTPVSPLPGPRLLEPVKAGGIGKRGVQSRRIVHLLVASGLAAGTLVAFALPASAQTGTGDVAAFCAARIEPSRAETKAENVPVLAPPRSVG
jgi:hypothetical protein